MNEIERKLQERKGHLKTIDLLIEAHNEVGLELLKAKDAIESEIAVLESKNRWSELEEILYGKH